MRMTEPLDLPTSVGVAHSDVELARFNERRVWTGFHHLCELVKSTDFSVDEHAAFDAAYSE